jgi:hypothetical protein
MSKELVVTVDLDWACEPAVEELLAFLEAQQIPATVFATHRSEAVECRSQRLDVGLHPYFASDSSHGPTVPAVVEHVLAIPHNLPAFRCHRFAVSNEAMQAMADAGMQISSNVCADMEHVPAFRNRHGLLEVPVFCEDGGYLHQRHPLEVTQKWRGALGQEGARVLLLHPMHWAINTPDFEYMARIKLTNSRGEWSSMSRTGIDAHRWRGHGVRDLIRDVFEHARAAGVTFTTLRRLAALPESRVPGRAYTPALEIRA